MVTSEEPENMIVEQYGSSSAKRIYLKVPGQSALVIHDEKPTSQIINWFTKIFLPKGYPDSVSEDYLGYQLWDTAQAFCSTITGILATQEVLRGVGVGDVTATPLAATVTWVIKDGCGHIGKILFAFTHGTYLDAYSKKWRLYADVLNDGAMCMEITLPYFKNFTTPILCASTAMRAIVGVAGGATRVAMTQHHAERGNMADVAAKDAAQETAVNLIASVTALLIISAIGNNIVVFMFLMMLHIIFNYLAVRTVCLRTMNEPRYLRFIDLYLKDEIVGAPCEINRCEPLLLFRMGSHSLDYKKCGFTIKMGVSMKEFIKQNPLASHLKNIKIVYEKQYYIIIPDVEDRKMFVFLKDNATSEDILRAYFNAVLLSIVTCVINGVRLSVYHALIEKTPFVHMSNAIDTSTRKRNRKHKPDEFKLEPTYELMQYVERVVENEWPTVTNGMRRTGWNINKNLLIVDEWRILSTEEAAKFIPTDDGIYEEMINRDLRVRPMKEMLNEVIPERSGRRVTYGIVEHEPSGRSYNIPATRPYNRQVYERRVRQVRPSNESPEIEVYCESDDEAVARPRINRQIKKKN